MQNSSSVLTASKEHVVYCFDILHGHLHGERVPPPGFEDALCPLFVTWNKSPRQGGEPRLRGCIGTLEARQLRKGLQDYALTSALRDRRFSPVQTKELPLLHCTVSLLHQFQQAADWQDWTVGVHGLIIEFYDPAARVQRSATFLPEVAQHEGWTRVETIDHLIAKAGCSVSVTSTLRASLAVTRYQSSAYSLSYDEYHAHKAELVTELEVDTRPTITVMA